MGADIAVYAGDMIFSVHRNIVVAHSGWFKDNLPPPNEVCLQELSRARELM